MTLEIENKKEQPEDEYSDYSLKIGSKLLGINEGVNSGN